MDHGPELGLGRLGSRLHLELPLVADAVHAGDAEHRPPVLRRAALRQLRRARRPHHLLHLLGQDDFRYDAAVDVERQNVQDGGHPSQVHRRQQHLQKARPAAVAGIPAAGAVRGFPVQDVACGHPAHVQLARQLANGPLVRNLQEGHLRPPPLRKAAILAEEQAVGEAALLRPGRAFRWLRAGDLRRRPGGDSRAVSDLGPAGVRQQVPAPGRSDRCAVVAVDFRSRSMGQVEAHWFANCEGHDEARRARRAQVPGNIPRECSPPLAQGLLRVRGQVRERGQHVKG
mmetsp:Transcript_1945/g.5873  ORF Transcript_1945/g.5873 Transcript_1945/m.5873 type:complete len:286 (+) Transcript_1945:601-1458(+)